MAVMWHVVGYLAAYPAAMLCLARACRLTRKMVDVRLKPLLISNVDARLGNYGTVRPYTDDANGASEDADMHFNMEWGPLVHVTIWRYSPYAV